MKSKQTLPLLVGIGPPRSGTTWVYELLRLHPQCVAPLIKETRYFSDWYERGSEAFLDVFPKPDAASRVLVDISPEYIGHPFVMDRIKETKPDAKIMIFLRNPYERIVSMYSYTYMKRFAHQEPRPIEMLRNPEVLKELTELSVIAATCEKYTCEFGIENVHFFDFQKLTIDPRQEALRIFRFLGLEPYFPASINAVVNPSFQGGNKTIRYAVGKLSRGFRKIGLDSVVDAVKYSNVNPIQLGSDPKKPVLPREQLAVLFEHFGKMFEEDARQLERLSGLDLSRWNKK